MKKWIDAEVEELSVKVTANPGKGQHNGVDNNTGNHYGWGNGNKKPQGPGEPPIEPVGPADIIS